MSTVAKNTNGGQFKIVLWLVAVLVPVTFIAIVAISVFGATNFDTATPEWLLWIVAVSFSIVGIGISVGFGALGIAFTMRVQVSVDEIEFLKEKDYERERLYKELSRRLENVEVKVESEAGGKEL